MLRGQRPSLLRTRSQRDSCTTDRDVVDDDDECGDTFNQKEVLFRMLTKSLGATRARKQLPGLPQPKQFAPSVSNKLVQLPPMRPQIRIEVLSEE